ADQRGEKLVKENVASSFQAAAVEVLVEKTCRALDDYPAKQLLVAGGVAANSGLRQELQAALADRHPEVALYFPPLKYCGDNAAMIGAAAYT
ncbi:tRNA (adenosine(37)-N6)-threonylcarbamoyltransferase complex transferase subunit TsaD, partial [Aerococcus urinae]|nr:tRNA (adenosine(37)-N6)-threonylcarbamoyltransferase complex transferase subunit TsaD [Aerococcus urinae]